MKNNNKQVLKTESSFINEENIVFWKSKKLESFWLISLVVRSDTFENFNCFTWKSETHVNWNKKTGWALTPIETQFVYVITGNKKLRNSKNMLIQQIHRSNQKQPSIGVLSKRCFENMRQIYRRTPMPKCDFNEVALQLYWNHTSAWVFYCKFAAYF